MWSSRVSIALILLDIGLSQCSALNIRRRTSSTCRNKPINTTTSPTLDDWNDLSNQVNGRLLEVVPSAKYCQEIGCTDFEWQSSAFRSTIPGAMDQYNWEQVCLINNLSFY